MRYTEQDVERVAEALCVAEFDNEYWETLKDGADGAPDAHAYQRELNHYLVMARAALEAMAREPVTAEQVQAYCKKRGLVMMTKNIAEHLTRQAR